MNRHMAFDFIRKLNTRRPMAAMFKSFRAIVSALAAVALPTIASAALTLNLDLDKSSGNGFTGLGVAPGAGAYWNTFLVPAKLQFVRHPTSRTAPKELDSEKPPL